MWSDAREIARSFEHLTRGKGPILAEAGGKLSNDRATQLEMCVEGHLIAAFGKMFVADVEAASEADLAVDDEQLSVISQVEPRGEEAGQKTADVEPASAERPIGGGERITRAHRVDEDTHFDAARLRCKEFLPEDLGDPPPIEDIAHHQDRLFGLFDRLEHRKIGVVPTFEHAHRVPLKKWV